MLAAAERNVSGRHCRMGYLIAGYISIYKVFETFFLKIEAKRIFFMYIPSEAVYVCIELLSRWI